MTRTDIILAYAKAKTTEQKDDLLRTLYNKVMDAFFVVDEIEKSSFRPIAGLVKDALESRSTQA